MNALTPVRVHDIYSAQQLNLIRQTVAKDCNTMEFDLFVTVARNAGLDPFRKQISAIVFNKDKPDKRQMAIITTIDGLRVIAARSKRYRPDEDEPVYEIDEAQISPLNPKGIVKAVVKIYVADSQREGGWKPVTGVAYWEEFAPIKDEWAENDAGKWKPTGKQTLDTGGNWGKMPRIMLAKCAEAQALRKAFPEDMSSLYERAEFDRQIVNDFTPSEQAAQFQTEARLQKVGANNGILFQMFPNTALESIPLGQVADKVIDVTREMNAKMLAWFESANLQPLREFWARAPGDALELKKHLESRREALAKEEAA